MTDASGVLDGQAIDRLAAAYRTLQQVRDEVYADPAERASVARALDTWHKTDLTPGEVASSAFLAADPVVIAGAVHVACLNSSGGAPAVMVASALPPGGLRAVVSRVLEAIDLGGEVGLYVDDALHLLDLCADAGDVDGFEIAASAVQRFIRPGDDAEWVHLEMDHSRETLESARRRRARLGAAHSAGKEVTPFDVGILESAPPPVAHGRARENPAVVEARDGWSSARDEVFPRHLRVDAEALGVLSEAEPLAALAMDVDSGFARGGGIARLWIAPLAASDVPTVAWAARVALMSPGNRIGIDRAVADALPSVEARYGTAGLARIATVARELGLPGAWAQATARLEGEDVAPVTHAPGCGGDFAAHVGELARIGVAVEVVGSSERLRERTTGIELTPPSGHNLWFDPTVGGLAAHAHAGPERVAVTLLAHDQVVHMSRAHFLDHAIALARVDTRGAELADPDGFLLGVYGAGWAPFYNAALDSDAIAVARARYALSVDGAPETPDGGGLPFGTEMLSGPHDASWFETAERFARAFAGVPQPGDGLPSLHFLMRVGGSGHRTFGAPSPVAAYRRGDALVLLEVYFDGIEPPDVGLILDLLERVARSISKHVEHQRPDELREAAIGIVDQARRALSLL